MPFVADMMRPDEILGLVEELHRGMGEIEVLVNNAGLGWFKPVHEFSECDWDTMVDTNLKAVFLLSKAVVPEMIARGSGSIINISSLAGKNTFLNGSVYCASKWGLMGLTGCMAQDLRGHGIRVAAVCPGSVATEFSSHSGKRPIEIAASGRRSACRGNDPHAGAAELYQRNTDAAARETLTGLGRGFGGHAPSTSHYRFDLLVCTVTRPTAMVRRSGRSRSRVSSGSLREEMDPAGRRTQSSAGMDRLEAWRTSNVECSKSN